MATCVFCLQDKVIREFSREHVFPDAIGGHFVIDSVCKTCNDDLGSRVDCLLTDHWLINMHRMFLNLGGKTGKVPNPLERGTLLENPDHKLRFRADARGELQQLFIVPSVRRSRNPDGTVTIEVCIDKSEVDKLPEIVNKIRKRAGHPPLPPETIIAMAMAQSIPRPWLVEEVVFDFVRYKRAILKIAYEFACHWLGMGYLEDQTGVLLRTCILDDDFWGARRQCPIRGSIDFVEAGLRFSCWRDATKSHIAFLMPNEGRITAYVRVFETIEALLVVSDKAEWYPRFQGMFLSNDPVVGSLREVPLLDEFARLGRGTT